MGTSSLDVSLTIAYYIQTYNSGTGEVSASPDDIHYSAPNYTAPYSGEAISLGSYTFMNTNSVQIACQLTAAANGSAKQHTVVHLHLASILTFSKFGAFCSELGRNYHRAFRPVG
ncbi:MAG: hypothetical protein JWN14_1788 [Chthonomonadales bacterium]|nr:hypothetical protein [Chthonomonadales bacterium]